MTSVIPDNIRELNAPSLALGDRVPIASNLDETGESSNRVSLQSTSTLSAQKLNKNFWISMGELGLPITSWIEALQIYFVLKV